MCRGRGPGNLLGMNTTETGQATQGPLDDFWAQRPVRPLHGRKVAGVAAGISARYGIDPLLTRILFVVTTFYSGVGVLIYLLGWLLLPGEGDETSPAEALVTTKRSATGAVLTIVLGILLIPTASIVVDGGFTAFLVLGLAGAALYLLHRNRNGSGSGAAPYPTPPTPGAPMPPASEGSVAAGMDAPTSVVDAPIHPATPPPPPPPNWAPPAYGPPPPPFPPKPPKRRSPVTAITFGVVLVVAAAMLLLEGRYGFSANGTEMFGVLLVVMGIGLVVGAFVRGGRGLILLVIPTILITLGSGVTHRLNTSGAHVNWSANSISEVQPSYNLDAGKASLDLTAVRVPAGETKNISVKVNIGEVNVTLPTAVAAEVSCKSGLGAVNCLDSQVGGLPSRVTASAPGEPEYGKIVLDVEVGTGAVEVDRG
ncbi:PspC domain-containing protein [Pseudonocardiaceae bacterium YIM PH 21723]|nr:PspC domain-containing protein [Pseudonocardiaceae bacterium YIM PH 21723]